MTSLRCSSGQAASKRGAFSGKQKAASRLARSEKETRGDTTTPARSATARPKAQ